MANLADLSRTLTQYLGYIRTMINVVPDTAKIADVADTLAGLSDAQLLADSAATANNHTANTNNPHQVTLAQVNGISRDEVNVLIQDKVPLNVLSISQFGDTSADDLGVTYNGWILRFTKEISSYLLATYRMMPVQNVDLRDVDSAPANKTFFVHLRVKAQEMMYEVSMTPLPETSDTMYLGRVVTNASGIVGHTLNRVTRIGTSRIASAGIGSGIPVTVGPTSQSARMDASWFPAPPVLPVTEGLVHRWPFIRNVRDAVGDVHASVESGSPRFTTISGRSGFHFSEGQLVTIPSFGTLGGSPWTISLWYYPDSLVGYTHLFTSKQGQNIFCLKLTATTSEFQGGVPYIHSTMTHPAQIRDITKAVSALRWSMLTFSYADGVGKVYINGNVAVMDNKALDIPESDWNVGRWTNEVSRGVHSDMLFYSRALSDAEVLTLYNES